MVTLNGELEWATASLTHPGQAVSGDRHVVAQTPTGILLGVVDGLGHGEEAAAAAEECVETLQEFCAEPVLPLMRRCHERLRRTRGATLSLAFVGARDGTLTWVGVGDVAGAWIRPAGGAPQRWQYLLCQAGVVGQNLPAIYAATLPLAPRDVMILATDGVRVGFAEGVATQRSCEEIAGSILEHYARGTDDALVLAARFLGGSSAYPADGPV